MRQIKCYHRIVYCAAIALLATSMVGREALAAPKKSSWQSLVASVPADSFRVRIGILSEHDESVAGLAVATQWLDHEINRKPQDQDKIMEALATVAWFAGFTSQYALADQLCRLLIDMAREYDGPRQQRLADAVRVHGGVLRGMRGNTEAKYALDEARCILESTNSTDTHSYGSLLWAESNSLRWINQDQCIEKMLQANEIFERVEPTPSVDTANMNAWIGWTSLQCGRHDLARHYLMLAEMEYHAMGLDDVGTMGVVISALADLEGLNGQWAEAEAKYRDVAGIYDGLRVKRGQNSYVGGFNLIAFAQIKQGRYDEAWRSLQHYRTTQASVASVITAQWHAGADAEFARVQDLRNQLAASTGLHQALEESPRPSLKAWRAMVDELELLARCQESEARYISKHPMPDPDPDRVSNLLGPDEAYVGWLDARFADALSISKGPFLSARLMYVMRPGKGVQWIPIYEITSREQDTPIRLKARRYIAIRNRAASWRQHVDDDPELNELARWAPGRVLGSSMPYLDGVKRLVMEFACYDEFIETDPLIGKDGRYLVDRFAVSYVPCAAVYTALRELPRPKPDEHLKVLAVGDPVFAGGDQVAGDSRLDATQLRDALDRNLDALDKLPRLVHSAEELDRVEALFGARVLRAEDASEHSLESLVESGELAKYDVVHIASHTLLDGAPERCAIALSRVGLDGSPGNDGLIDATEIRLSWKLRAQLVTLSGCQTAGVAFSRGEPQGIVQAMLGAGARCVLVSNWKVDDLATSMLMQRFYENVATGRGMGSATSRGNRISYSEALKEAKVWLREYRDATGSRPYAHPIYWAGFFLVGDAN